MIITGTPGHKVCQEKNDYSGRAFSLGTLDSAQWVEADNGFNVTFSATTDSFRLESNTKLILK